MLIYNLDFKYMVRPPRPWQPSRCWCNANAIIEVMFEGQYVFPTCEDHILQVIPY